MYHPGLFEQLGLTFVPELALPQIPRTPGQQLAARFRQLPRACRPTGMPRASQRLRSQAASRWLPSLSMRNGSRSCCCMVQNERDLPVASTRASIISVSGL